MFSATILLSRTHLNSAHILIKLCQHPLLFRCALHCAAPHPVQAGTFFLPKSQVGGILHTLKKNNLVFEQVKMTAVLNYGGCLTQVG